MNFGSCGRWRNGRLASMCMLAGTEECDFECPYRDAPDNIEGCADDEPVAAPRGDLLEHRPMAAEALCLGCDHITNEAMRCLPCPLRKAADGVTPSAPAGKAPEDSYPDQTVLHAEGQCGNCLQATIAGVLGWPLAAVPHFALLGEDHWWDCMQAWLDSQGYWIDYQPTSYAAQGGELLPRCWLSGRSPRGFSHAVIGDTATLQMLHDPHPTRAGLVSVDYTIYFFRKPAHGVIPSAEPNKENRNG